MQASWFSKLLALVALVALLVRTLRGRPLPQLPPGSMYPWDTCSDCRAPLPDRVFRLMDASYCQPCHEEREAALD